MSKINILQNTASIRKLVKNPSIFTKNKPPNFETLAKIRPTSQRKLKAKNSFRHKMSPTHFKQTTFKQTTKLRHTASYSKLTTGSKFHRLHNVNKSSRTGVCLGLFYLNKPWNTTSTWKLTTRSKFLRCKQTTKLRNTGQNSTGCTS